MPNKYEVHGISQTQIDVEATDKATGEHIVGKVNALIVELIPVDHIGGSIREIVRIATPDAKAQAQDMFEVGGVVEHQGWKKIRTAAGRTADKKNWSVIQ